MVKYWDLAEKNSLELRIHKFSGLGIEGIGFEELHIYCKCGEAEDDRNVKTLHLSPESWGVVLALELACCFSTVCVVIL